MKILIKQWDNFLVSYLWLINNVHKLHIWSLSPKFILLKWIVAERTVWCIKAYCIFMIVTVSNVVMVDSSCSNYVRSYIMKYMYEWTSLQMVQKQDHMGNSNINCNSTADLVCMQCRRSIHYSYISQIYDC